MSNDFIISKTGNALVGITGSRVCVTEIPRLIETFAPFLSFNNYFYPLSLEGFGVGAVIAPKNSSFNLCKFLKSFIACNESRVAGLVPIGNFCKFSSGSNWCIF
ncbi:hypothetical protein H0E87_016124 [Populus deltoides]|uniref:Uncharacterized protein n=1 Tax=Populus deltoides TaxID=3696 RepID=A0A8T2Y7P0_POPDE|nr:hypothetical protein H0E87_016124 [Populus deltoides]